MWDDVCPLPVNLNSVVSGAIADLTPKRIASQDANLTS